MPQEWITLRREDIRLRTFNEHFSATFLSPLLLAKAGFFYVGVDDQVQCAFCRGVVRDWEINDDPRREHQRLFPSCAFILGLPVGNIPLGENPSTVHLNVERTASLPVPQQLNIGFGATRQFTSQFRPNASPDTELRSPDSMQLNALVGENLEELGITKHSGPRYSSYATLDARLKSYNNWPSHLKQTPRAMALSGFFHLGTNDHVNCFHCGSGLRNWEPEDDPWLEHARWFPQCRFVMLMKGEQYIKEATESMSNHPKAKPSLSASVGNSRASPREASEADLRSLLGTPIVQTVLAMGVDLSRVRQALKYQIRTTGQPFNTVDSLLEAAIEIQHHSEHRQSLEDGNYEDVDWPSAVPSSSRRRVTSTGYTLVELPVSLSTPSDEHRTNTNENVPIVPLVSEVRSETPLSHREMDTLSKPENPEKIKEQSCALEVSASCETSTQSVDRTQILEEEIRRLKEARLCKVCLDEEVSIAYIPCGHIVTCVQCAAALEHCPLCRKNIKGTVRIFLS
ncbi:baculoviral IAP repeat-containing protein 7-B-like isoform X2 [Daphnia pulex]|uniref:baculoviral IAP repeat-containing protein 7-B-like isoform X2 n=1 Tax=Daphnia pulex TaxID=6669 RepID=UPI001EDD0E37|nr:baculoviral IAP repeat-containing protein 7-B-like isoform X2 [Daphnia pulex]